ncbi:hypothetical protein F5890DRAFT_1576170 [Lentinula detonsa]|uniref:Uncharacterized protein n=1 Tax=Lentinula detonsa TaxID=2804962 RepID=A0AA38UL60_9AGAR|nr:hypothetical protein F5890DRAFT_1576170 [Lentinula detonsa]
MRLKSYLSFQPTWTKVVDALFALNVSNSERKVDPAVRVNIFLQSLKTLTETAKKYGLRIEGIAFSRIILRNMPIWYHREADPLIRSMNSTKASVCLRTKHKIRTVGETVDLTTKIQDEAHTQSSMCECTGCNEIRAKSELPEDYQGEYRTSREENRNNIKPFDKRIRTAGSISDIFRIFTDPDTKTTNQLPNLKEPAEIIEDVVAATDGSCENNGEENTRAGAGIFIADGSSKNKSIKLPKYQIKPAS